MLLTAGGNSQEILAVVDSGATRSFFPKIIATQLGIDDELVICDWKGSGAGDEKFPVWESAEPVTAQVIREEDDGTKTPWGPDVPLDPVFAEKGSLLLGVRDFFAAFDIEFTQRDSPPKFYLNYHEA